MPKFEFLYVYGINEGYFNFLVESQRLSVSAMAVCSIYTRGSVSFSHSGFKTNFEVEFCYSTHNDLKFGRCAMD